jgi:hypothetical protein
MDIHAGHRRHGKDRGQHPEDGSNNNFFHPFDSFLSIFYSVDAEISDVIPSWTKAASPGPVQMSRRGWSFACFRAFPVPARSAANLTKKDGGLRNKAHAGHLKSLWLEE